MSSHAAHNTFITYNSPAEFHSRQNRRAVSSHASKSHRPTARRIVLDRTHYRPFLRRPDGDSYPPARLCLEDSLEPDGEGTPHSTDSVEVSPPRMVEPLDERVLGSPLSDPFTTYPIEYRTYVPFLTDYFIRSLTPRFSPALGVETSRYLIWFNVAMQHQEMFHALISLSQVYYSIDVKGFGNTDWTALYHRGEALKYLRLKVETAQCADDDAAILTALWLMDVDAANGDIQAFAMHKRAKERMVLTRGGIRKLNPELQDELLKSEFFLPLLLHGTFVCEVTEDNVLVRFKENTPINSWQARGLPPLFSGLVCKGLLTTQAVEILRRIFRQISQGASTGRSCHVSNVDHGALRPLKCASNEMSRVLRVTDEARPKTLHHRILLALLVYIFNLHNQARSLPPTTASSPNTASARQSYLSILSNVALELSTPSDLSDSASVTEREVTLWTVVAIGSASSFSPWRLEIPFMSHLIELMAPDGDGYASQNVPKPVASDPRTPGITQAISLTGKPRSNLDRLTACLRGYYLYGADKQTLRTLRPWNSVV